MCLSKPVIDPPDECILGLIESAIKLLHGTTDSMKPVWWVIAGIICTVFWFRYTNKNAGTSPVANVRVYLYVNMFVERITPDVFLVCITQMAAYSCLASQPLPSILKRPTGTSAGKHLWGEVWLLKNESASLKDVGCPSGRHKLYQLQERYNFCHYVSAMNVWWTSQLTNLLELTNELSHQI